MPDTVHSGLWHFLTIQSMCFDCSAGSGSWSKWITLFLFFSLPVYWWNSFTSEANSGRIHLPHYTHAHTHTQTLHPQHLSLKDSHCQCIPPTPSCYTYKVNMYGRCVEKVITGAFHCRVSEGLYINKKNCCLFILHQRAVLLHWLRSEEELLQLFVIRMKNIYIFITKTNIWYIINNIIWYKHSAMTLKFFKLRLIFQHFYIYIYLLICFIPNLRA